MFFFLKEKNRVLFLDLLGTYFSRDLRISARVIAGIPNGFVSTSSLIVLRSSSLVLSFDFLAAGVADADTEEEAVVDVTLSVDDSEEDDDDGESLPTAASSTGSPPSPFSPLAPKKSFILPSSNLSVKNPFKKIYIRHTYR